MPGNYERLNLGNIIMAITPEIYERKRDELIGLLDNVLKLPQKWERLPLINDSAPTRHETIEYLTKIQSRLKANQFKIVLVAAFQGGKSTTFNIFCDGREVSPVGCMLKTSACIIEARNIDKHEDNQNERALIHWRTKEDLCLGFVQLLKTQLVTLDYKRFSDKTSEQIAKDIDLDLSKDRDLLKKAVDGEWQTYQGGRRKYRSGDIDILRIATIVSQFYNCEKLKILSSKPQFDIREVGYLLTFSEDWDARWEELGIDGFQFEEVVFAFIGHVECLLHSENLSRLGCVVVDCPGLFASPWDTEVARGAMFGADAIWFLIGGDRQIGQDGLEVAQWLSDNKMDHKLFYSINAKAISRELIENRIIPADAAALKKMGLNVEQKDLAPYNAFLALRAVQGKKLINGAQDILDKYTEEKIIEHSRKFGYERVDKVSDAWLRPVRKTLETMRPGKYLTTETDEDGNEITKSKIKNINDETINVVLRESELEPTLMRIEGCIVERRAEAILVYGGSEKASEVLMIFKSRLEDIVRMSEIGKDDALKNYKILADKLDEYAKFCKEEFVLLDDDNIDRDLAEDYYNKVLTPSPSKCSNKIAYRINEEIGLFEDLGMAGSQIINAIGAIGKFFNNGTPWWEEFEIGSGEGTIRSIIEEEVSYVTNPASEDWLNSILNGSNACLKDSLFKKVEFIRERASKRWVELNFNSIPEFSGMLLPPRTPTINVVTNNIASNKGFDSLKGYGMDICILLALSALAAVLPVIGPIFAAVTSVVLIAIRRIWGAFNPEGRINNIKQEVEKSLTHGFEEKRYIMTLELKPRMSSFRLFYKMWLEDEFITKNKKILCDMMKKAEFLFNEKQDQLKAIAHESQIVLSDIEDLNKRIFNFGSEVSKLVNDGNRHE